ncbi:MAG TPA: hypothetical protein VMU80_22475 [Bryobacteraceae bacterium]|nr:hypothetical protein [Bryobacteraceae bacterium]HUO32003.1 hypothetical protein [Bryobacteraceae bacterium]
MADAPAPALPPKKTSRRIVLSLILLVAAYLGGFIPEWLKAREQSQARERAEHALTVTRLEKDLGSAAIEARRGQYEAARQDASTFFMAARFEIDQGDKSALTGDQRKNLTPLLDSRDQLITLIARSDPASGERLSDLYVAVRKALGV